MIIFSINELASQKIDAFSCLHVALLPDAIITADLVHLRKTPLFFEVSLCLSRARLGKMFVFIIYKWRKKWRFCTRPLVGPRAGPPPAPRNVY